MSGSLQLGDVVLGIDHSGASKPAISGPGRPSTASSRRASLASVGLSVEVGDGLDDMFCTTAVQLACMWDELGLSEAERDTAIRAFRARVEDVMESAVREFRGKVATAKKAIDGAADKILDMAKALGEEADLPMFQPGTPLNAQYADVQNLLQEVTEAYHARVEKLESLHAQLHQVWEELGPEFSAGREEGFARIGNNMSQARVGAYEEEIAAAEREMANRTSAISEAIGDVLDLWDEMGEEPQTDFERALTNNGAGLGVTLDVIQQISELASALTAKKAAYEQQIKELGVQITALWDRLKVEDAVRDEWLSGHTGVGQAVVDACQAKLRSLQVQLQESLGPLIQQTRASITEMWDTMHYAQSQRDSEFPYMAIPREEFTDEVLEKHEAYALHLASELAKLRPILKFVEQRQHILKQREEYEAMMNDSSRLLQRRGHDTRLQEEKLERRVKKVLPAVTKKLKAALHEWEETHGSPFVWEGVAYVEVIEQQEADYRQHLEEEKERKAAEKAARLQQDIDFGSSPQPKQRRTRSKTPHRTPSKSRLDTTSAAHTPARAARTPGASTPGRTTPARTPARRLRAAGTAAKVCSGARSRTRTPGSSRARPAGAKARTPAKENAQPAEAGAKKATARSKASGTRAAEAVAKADAKAATKTPSRGRLARANAPKSKLRTPRARTPGARVRHTPQKDSAPPRSASTPRSPHPARSVAPTSLKSIIGSPARTKQAAASSSASGSTGAGDGYRDAARAMVPVGSRSGLTGAFTAMLDDCDDEARPGHESHHQGHKDDAQNPAATSAVMHNARA